MIVCFTYKYYFNQNLMNLTLCATKSLKIIQSNSITKLKAYTKISDLWQFCCINYIRTQYLVT